MNKYLYSIIILLFLSACTDDNATPLLANAIKGTWRLTISSGGFDGKTHNIPTDSMFTITFASGNRYEQKRNGALTASGTYKLGKTKSIYTGQVEDAVQFNQNDLWQLVKINGNTLSMALNAYDGVTGEYERVK